MKSTWHLLIAAGAVAALAIGPADSVASGEPMELTDAQLDYVTAGQGGGIFNTGTITIIESTLPGLGGVNMTLGDGSVRFISEPLSLSVSPSPGTTTRPAEFVIIRVGQKTLELTPAQR